MARWMFNAVATTIMMLAPIVAGGCCDVCLSQTDPKTTVITYDPLVHSQCSAAIGICCYGCSFSHGNPEFQSGVAFDSNGTSIATAGKWISFTFTGITRVTYDFLQTNQLKTGFVGNESTEAKEEDGVFSICVEAAGIIAFRGWGDDSCTEVTVEETIKVVDSDDGSSVCAAGPVHIGFTSSSGSGLRSTSTTPTSTAVPEPAGSLDESNISKCNPTRGSVLTRKDGTQYCECTGDWRNPPYCDKFSYTRLLLTIGGGVATVLSIVFSIRAYLKSRKAATAERINGTNDDIDQLSDSEETIRIERQSSTTSISQSPFESIECTPKTTQSANIKSSRETTL